MGSQQECTRILALDGFRVESITWDGHGANSRVRIRAFGPVRALRKGAPTAVPKICKQKAVVQVHNATIGGGSRTVA